MDIKYLNQPKDIKIAEILNEKLSKGKFDTVWLISGIVKDSGFDLVWDSLQSAAERGIRINVIIGIDKKNTSKDLLTRLLKLGCSVRYYNNNEGSKFETRAYIFEKAGGTSYVYLTSGKFSEGGLLENNCLVIETKYTAKDSEKLESLKNSLLSGLDESFKVLDEEKIQELSNSGDIFARITERKIPSINDIFNKCGITEIQEYDESISCGYTGEIYEDVDFDVELPPVAEKPLELRISEKPIKDKKEKEKKEKIKTINKEAIDLETLWKEQNDAIAGTKSSKKINVVKDPDYKHMSTLIMQINKVTFKGVGSNEIKIPNSMLENMNDFFGWPKEFELIDIGKGKTQSTSKVSFEIIDNKDTNNEMKDDEAMLYKTERYLAINSSVLNELIPEENDIIRLIKVGNKKYKVELIRQDTSEYVIWERYCVNAIKGQTRKFGII